MSAANTDNLSKERLIQQTAERLSPELQAEYYRILRHCRSLPQNDEMLLVLNAIQILFSLIIDVPNRMAAEAERMETLLGAAVKAQDNVVRAFGQYQTELDQRLARLPDDIAKRLQPEVIAAKITESLRQQFAETTIPETAKLLRAGVDDINTLGVDLRSGARTIGRVLKEATLEANGFLTRVQTACLDGTERVAGAAERIAAILKGSVGGLMLLACGVGVAIGLTLGIFLHGWWTSPSQPVQPAVIQSQTTPAAPPTETRPKTPVHRK